MFYRVIKTFESKDGSRWGVDAVIPDGIVEFGPDERDSYIKAGFLEPLPEYDGYSRRRPVSTTGLYVRRPPRPGVA